MIESWKSLNEWYDVSDMGRVRSWHNNRWGRRREPRILSPDLKAAHGYPRVNIDREARLIHHLILETFIGPRYPGYEGAHRNGNKQDNRIENLYWATPKQNGEDNARLGVSKGELHGMAKLTEEDVRAIRASDQRHAVLATRFGVSKTNISIVRSRKGWSHVQ